MQYTIKMVSSLLGIKIDTLRKWEMRHRFLAPRRSGNRYRMYDDADLEKIECFLELCRSGRPAREAAEAARKTVRKGSEFDRTKSEAWKAIINLDRGGLERIFERLLKTQGLEASFQSVWMPLFEKAGVCGMSPEPVWIAREHFFTACIRGLMMRSLRRGKLRPEPSLALAAPEGEYHELGMILASHALAERGIPSLYIGANTPTAGLCGMLKGTRVRHLCMTLTHTMERADFKRLVSELRADIPNVRLYFAGLGSLPLANLIPKMGAVFLGTNLNTGLKILVEKIQGSKARGRAPGKP